MSVGTNENYENDKNIEITEKDEAAVNAENTGVETVSIEKDKVENPVANLVEKEELHIEGNVKNQTVNKEETQKIVILDELIRDTENSVMQKIDVINSCSEISTEPIAQAENCSENELYNKSVQKNPIDEDMKNKEKQHAQDKKDYRLEKMLFDRINKMQGKIKESLELIKKFERINAKEENLPNIVTTLHDKLTQEVIKQFRTIGIEFNMKSYLVQSIVSDLLNKFEDGITEFRDCSENLNFVREVQEDFESKVELAPTSRVKNFFARLRGMFKPERKQERIEQLERERQGKKLEEANIHLIKYKFINSELEKYTIKNNIVSSLTREILHGQGSGLTLNVNEFIENKIFLEMKKLGLEDLIPVLKDKLFEEYKLKDESILRDDFMSLSVGEIRRNMKMQKAELVINKINAVVAGKSEEEEMVG